MSTSDSNVNSPRPAEFDAALIPVFQFVYPTESANAIADNKEQNSSSCTSSSINSSKAGNYTASIDASIPILPYPWLSMDRFNDIYPVSSSDAGESDFVVQAASSSQVAYINPTSYDEEKSKIVLNAMDKWSDSLRNDVEAEDRAIRQGWAEKNASIKSQQDLVIDTMHSADYQTWVASLATVEKLKEVYLEQLHTKRVELSNGIDNYVDRIRSGKDGSHLSFMAGVFLIGATAFVGAVTPPIKAEIVCQAPVGLPGQCFDHFIAFTPKDMRAELGLIGAMFMTGMIYYTTAETIARGRKKGPLKNLAFARNFAKNVIQYINSQELNLLVRNMRWDAISKKRNKKGTEQKIDPRKEQQKERLITVLKIGMLSNALALYYKTETGKITSEEFAAMLSGNIVLKPGGVDAAMVNLLRIFLKLLPEELRNRLMEGLLSYMDSDPKIEFMLDPQKLFSSIMKELSDKTSVAA